MLELANPVPGLIVDVFDVHGRCVRSLREGPVAAGLLAIVWDGRDDAGRALPGGVYFMRASTGSDISAAVKVLLVGR
jgi:flagellar hook assembly protein FlgD